MPKCNDKKPEDAKKQREEELQDLWGRRDDLNELEWDRLYKLINLTLAPSAKIGRHLSLLNSLHKLTCEDYDFYFQGFFFQKVFLPARQEGFVANTLVHSGALHTYFRRFLLDRLDEIKHEIEYSEKENGQGENDKYNVITRTKSSQSSTEFTPNEAPIEQENSTKPVIKHILIDSLPAATLDKILSGQTHHDLPDPDWRPSPEQEWRLWDIGLDLPTLTASAKDFFNRLTPEKQLLFKECFVNKKPLSDLQGRVKNVYNAAAELGIKLRKDEKKFVDYCKTHIGEWLASLGLYLDRHDRDPKRPQDPDKLKVVFIVLQILRACALDGIDAKRRSGTGPDDPPQPDA